jgi:hypothetical protein
MVERSLFEAFFVDAERNSMQETIILRRQRRGEAFIGCWFSSLLKQTVECDGKWINDRIKKSSGITWRGVVTTWTSSSTAVTSNAESGKNGGKFWKFLQSPYQRKGRLSEVVCCAIDGIHDTTSDGITNIGYTNQIYFLEPSHHIAR